MTKWADVIFMTSGFVILYHHLIYPRLLSFFSKWNRSELPVEQNGLHHFVFIIPACNEADFIVKKIDNLAAVDYPKEHFEVLVLSDGSTDNTVLLARAAASKYPELKIIIKDYPTNRGKVALFNDVIPDIPNDCILFLSDASSSLSAHVLRRANAWFNNDRVGVVSTQYQLKKQVLGGEKYYWHYQCQIKAMESNLGSPMGYHGSGYAMRRSLWQKLPVNTINDDFVMPLRAVAKGYVGIYDTKMTSVENEPSSDTLDWRRRVRIARGNIQQIVYLFSLLSPGHGFVAWMFFSGKVLRVGMPWFLLMLLISNAFLAVHQSVIFLPVLAGQFLFYSAGILNLFVKSAPFSVIAYFIKGHVASLVGWFSLCLGYGKQPWMRSDNFSRHWNSSFGRLFQRTSSTQYSHFIHPGVRIGKWMMDKTAALPGLTVFILLFPIIGVLIKLSSQGPILYKQIRVGKGTEKKTRFFYLYKFRTMHIHAEENAPQWTRENDPRIFGFGHFLRKSHLDELPQFFNILKGDMSLVGPRPERPSIYPNLEKHIPCYEERLFEMLPGLTGLAQVVYRYDKSIEDVRRKVAFDHAYAVCLANPWIWFRTDMMVLFKTVGLVFLRKGF